MTVDVNPPGAGRAEYIFAGGVGYDVKVRALHPHRMALVLRTPWDLVPRTLQPTQRQTI